MTENYYPSRDGVPYKTKSGEIYFPISERWYKRLWRRPTNNVGEPIPWEFVPSPGPITVEVIKDGIDSPEWIDVTHLLK